MSDDPDRTRSAAEAPRAGAPPAREAMRWARRTLSGVRQLGGAVLSKAGLRPARAGQSPAGQGSMPTEFFDALYADNPDPWHFTASAYEAEKYAATLAALPRPHYGSVLEVGCSIGVLTAQLAPRCDRLLAIDAAAAPLEAARGRTAGFPHVEVRRARVPEKWPAGRFDLILLSEILYFFDAGDLGRLAAQVAAALAPGGDVVLVHWTGPSKFPHTGDAAVEGFRAALGDAVAPLRADRAENYRLDVLRRTDAAGAQGHA